MAMHEERGGRGGEMNSKGRKEGGEERKSDKRGRGKEV